jgi:hypothetical protein
VSQLNGPHSPGFWPPAKNQLAGTSYERTYMGCSTMRNFTRNHGYLFYLPSVAKILAMFRANKEIRGRTVFFSREKKKDRQADRFHCKSGTQNSNINGNFKKSKSVDRFCIKIDRSTDKQSTDFIFRDTLLNGFLGFPVLALVCSSSANKSFAFLT